MKSLADTILKAVAGLGFMALAACAQSVPPAPVSAARTIANSPAADYPMVLGDPFTVDGVVYTPEDTMNYDRVGYTTVDQAAAGVTGAHRTLPLPSYVEVTSLESGRTILVRIERRGPMTNDRLIALSPAALDQLGIGEGAPVRMRRMNPPEEHRAELRAGREAPPRMDTPVGLLDVLKRRLPERGSVELADPRQAQVSGSVPTPGAIASIDPNEDTQPVETEQPVIAATPVAAAEVSQDPPAQPVTTEAGGKYAVQLGAFSVRANADRLARKVGGYVETSGSLALVRVGPYATRGQAGEALAKLRAQGYSDAQLRTLD